MLENNTVGGEHQFDTREGESDTKGETSATCKSLVDGENSYCYKTCESHTIATDVSRTEE